MQRTPPRRFPSKGRRSSKTGHYARVREAVFAEAAQLPLLDAAYMLYRKRKKLGRRDEPSAADGQKADLKWDGVVEKVEAALAQVKREIEDGRRKLSVQCSPIFHYLKFVHPEASYADLEEAVRAAVKLHHAYIRYYPNAGVSDAEVVGLAMDRVRQENPGFLQETYESANRALSHAMR